MEPPVFVTGRAEKAREAERLGFRLERVDLDLAEPQALDPADIVEWKALTSDTHRTEGAFIFRVGE